MSHSRMLILNMLFTAFGILRGQGPCEKTQNSNDAPQTSVRSWLWSPSPPEARLPPLETASQSDGGVAHPCCLITSAGAVGNGDFCKVEDPLSISLCRHSHPCSSTKTLTDPCWKKMTPGRACQQEVWLRERNKKNTL